MNKNVTVKFSAPLDSTWSFDPKVTPVKKNGTVTLEAEATATWTFRYVTGLPDDWDYEIKEKGKRLVITDTNVPNQKSFEYTVTVKDPMYGEFTSPLVNVAHDASIPPVIQNDGS